MDKRECAADIYIISRASYYQSKKLHQYIQKVSLVPPLSKYELFPSIHIISLEKNRDISMLKKKITKNYLWKYSKGITHFAKERKDLNAILSNKYLNNKQCPDIFSDIFIRIT
jgi:hypothetical protein